MEWVIVRQFDMNVSINTKCNKHMQRTTYITKDQRQKMNDKHIFSPKNDKMNFKSEPFRCISFIFCHVCVYRKRIE